MENPNGYNQMQNLRNLLGHEIPSNFHTQSARDVNNDSVYVELTGKYRLSFSNAEGQSISPAEFVLYDEK